MQVLSFKSDIIWSVSVSPFFISGIWSDISFPLLYIRYPFGYLVSPFLYQVSGRISCFAFLYQVSGQISGFPFLYPVSGRISGFPLFISGIRSDIWFPLFYIRYPVGYLVSLFFPPELRNFF
jgi:hypothetical protein